MYKWYFNYDSDEEAGWHGGYDTRAQALAEGVENATGFCKTIVLIEASPAPLSLDFVADAEAILEQIREVNEDLSDENGDVGMQDCSSEQAVELEIEVTETIRQWLIRHDFNYSPYAFGDRRNEEILDVAPLIEPSR
jgi:hypothetical protein